MTLFIPGSEARGYQGGDNRSKLRELQITKLDIFGYIIFVLVIAVLFVTRTYG